MRTLLPLLLLVACKGPEGPAGASGTACWDLDGDGAGGTSEDANGDGSVDVRDCVGQNGNDGNDGNDGANGNDGTDGAPCWDLDADGVQDPTEDVNKDASWDALDCAGNDGTDGKACWDLNGDGLQDPAEDLDGDGDADVQDCAGPWRGTFDGMVVDADNGALIANALVVLDPTGASTHTGVDGKFQFLDVPFGSYDVIASSASLLISGTSIVAGPTVTSRNADLALHAGEQMEVVMKLARIDRENTNLTTVHKGGGPLFLNANCESCHTKRANETTADPTIKPYHALTTHESLQCTFCHTSALGVSVENEDGWSFESASTLRKQTSLSTCQGCHTCYPTDYCTGTGCPNPCP